MHAELYINQKPKNVINYQLQKIHMKIAHSNKWLIVVIILLIVGWFYWFQYRPAHIKQQCSYVHRHTDAVAARSPMTIEQIKQQGLYEDCSVTPDGSVDAFFKSFCERRMKLFMEGNVAQEAKDWDERASIAEYNFCIHSKGL